MKVDFTKFPLFTGIDRQDMVIADIRKDIADGIYRNVPGLPAHVLAEKIYRNELVELADDEIHILDLFLVFINGRGDIMAGAAGKQEAIDLRQLKDRTKEFILNPLDDENLPEKANKDIELPDGGKWVYPVSEGVVSLQTTRDTGYQSYIMVQNELTRAFNEVRDEVAQRKFGAKFADLPEELRNAVSKAVPLKISEAEPRNIKK